jgi:hypothetical protein
MSCVCVVCSKARQVFTRDSNMGSGIVTRANVN